MGPRLEKMGKKTRGIRKRRKIKKMGVKTTKNSIFRVGGPYFVLSGVDPQICVPCISFYKGMTI